MIVRLTFCHFLPDRIDEVKKVYGAEIAPEVKKQKGNLGIRLLLPDDKSEACISVTEWKTKADADAYHTSGLYKTLVSRLQEFFSGPPELKTYSAEEVFEASPHVL